MIEELHSARRLAARFPALKGLAYLERPVNGPDERKRTCLVRRKRDGTVQIGRIGNALARPGMGDRAATDQPSHTFELPGRTRRGAARAVHPNAGDAPETGLITFDCVAADGTKIRADAGRAHSTAMASDPVSFRISVTPGSLLFVNSSFPGPGPNEQPIERSQLAQRISRRPRGLSNRKGKAQ